MVDSKEPETHSKLNGNNSHDNVTLPSSATYTVPFSHRLHASYSHPLLRQWQNSAAPIQPYELMYPLFIADGDPQLKMEIKALPGQYRWGTESVVEHIVELYHQYGLQSVLLFGVLSDDNMKTADAHMATSKKNPCAIVIPQLRKQCPNLVIAVDICLCAYTHHGHCGILRESDGSIDNEASIKKIAEMSLNLAQAGAHIVAPSDMMDGRSGAIKAALRHAKLDGVVSLMTYSAKFASCLYGPFRDAASSGAKFGDRQGYQLPPASKGLAVRALERDIEEGADFIIVKPSIWYLDIVSEAARRTNVPLAIYHVSGEYAMLWHAAQAGAFDLRTAVTEHMMSAKRAGATLLITYYTPSLLKWMKEDSEKLLKQQGSR